MKNKNYRHLFLAPYGSRSKNRKIPYIIPTPRSKGLVSTGSATLPIPVTSKLCIPVTETVLVLKPSLDEIITINLRLQQLFFILKITSLLTKLSVCKEDRYNYR
jgi:hypothetical protein